MPACHVFVMEARSVVVGLLVATLVGCGDSTKSKSNFTSCRVTESECVAGICTQVEECDVDECKSETTYFFDETEYESRCTFGETRTAITYPLAGGPGEQVTRRDLDECYYEAEFDGNDFEEQGTCTRVRDCTIDTLDCDDSEPGDPDCRVVASRSCPGRVD